MKPFRVINLETSSLCNRNCPTCLRNSYPDREAVRDWFTQKLMPMDMIEGIFLQLAEMDYRGRICFTNFNEPLMDDRIIEIAQLAKDTYELPFMHLITNGDLLTEDLAKELDEVFDRITISLYEQGAERQNRRNLYRQWFKKTSVWIKGTHIVTHYNTQAEYNSVIPRRLKRLIINHKGEYMMCCDDIAGEFNLGSFPELSIKDHWYGEKFSSIVKALGEPDGKEQFPYCAVCPRGWCS